MAWIEMDKQYSFLLQISSIVIDVEGIDQNCSFRSWHLEMRLQSIAFTIVDIFGCVVQLED